MAQEQPPPPPPPPAAAATAAAVTTATPADRFQPPGELGYPAAIDTVGTIAAPLLAGFSATLVGLLLDTLHTNVRWPDMTALLLLISVLAFIATIQFTFNARRWSVTPSELESWYSHTCKSYWVSEQRRYLGKYLPRARATRVAYRLGIVSFLSGFTLVLVPPGSVGLVRGLTVGAAALGAAAEVVWIVIDLTHHG